MKIGDQLAFPVDDLDGMTKRELLIAAALSGIGYDYGGTVISGAYAADRAVARADAVLEILEQEVADAKSKV